MQITQGFGGAGAGGAVKVLGNGIVVHNGGQLSTVALNSVDPLRIVDPEGIGGPPLLRIETPGFPLGKLIGALGNVTTDQPIPIKGCTQYILRRIVFTHSNQTPVAMAGGVYPLVGKAGTPLVAASQTYTTLDGPMKFIEVTVTPVLLAAPFLYLSLTTANATALTLDVFAFGDAVVPLED
jgi:hypothetical protein